MKGWLDQDNVEIAYLIDPDERVLAQKMKYLEGKVEGKFTCQGVADVRQALDEMPAKIEAQTEKIITGIKTQYAIDKRREDDLQDQLRRARSDGLDLSETSSEMAMLDSDLKEKRRIYELITTRIKEIEDMTTMQRQRIRKRIEKNRKSHAPASDSRLGTPAI